MKHYSCGILNKEKVKNIKENSEFKEKFQNVDERSLKGRHMYEKFNIAVSDLRDSLGVRVTPETSIDLVIEPHFLQGQDKLKVIEMEDQEIVELLLKNSRSGIYKSVEYIKNLFPEYKPNNDFSFYRKKPEMKFYKVYHNGSNLKQLIEYISKYIDSKTDKTLH